ncbi:hypothetical protein GS597_02645 [Synechococcales cyanobacterium C]|uniref:Uncharacterized protein n=1 Tax=Petrachloros mirabilis ULC683 TaxID=2781853 RepID=A0A8K1ZWJ2_9CYAN|nr:hypothetical protein [Petrachloros mirabilis]NCJ05428.1 hypothetical protein [Petrachloros mirabilis ULC683]
MMSPFTGQWSYRSFINNPDLSVEFNELQFGLGNLVLEAPQFGEVAGTLGGEGWSLDLKGWSSYGSPFEIRFQGNGVIGGEQWVYDYHGFLAPKWPNGNAQRAAILGTIVRTIPHSNGQAEAGFVASWIAVKS